MRLQRAVEILRRLGQRAHDAAGEDDEGKAERLQFARRAAIGVLPPSTMLAISGVECAHQRANAAELGALARRLDEQHVGARFAIKRGARDGALEAFDGDRIGAGDDQRLARAARIDRRLDLADHLRRRDQRLVVEMAAALGKILILDLDGIGAGALEQAHRALDIERIAVAGVGIDNEMGRDAVADQRDCIDHLGHADQADVGPAEPRIGDGRAGDIERLETGLFGDQRGKRVVDARRDQDRRARQAGA